MFGQNRLLSPREVGQILNVSVRTVRRLVQQGQLGCVEISFNNKRFSANQIETFIKSRLKEPVKRIDTSRKHALISPHVRDPRSLTILDNGWKAEFEDSSLKEDLKKLSCQ